MTSKITGIPDKSTFYYHSFYSSSYNSDCFLTSILAKTGRIFTMAGDVIFTFSENKNINRVTHGQQRNSLSIELLLTSHRMVALVCVHAHSRATRLLMHFCHWTSNLRSTVSCVCIALRPLRYRVLYQCMHENCW